MHLHFGLVVKQHIMPTALSILRTTLVEQGTWATGCENDCISVEDWNKESILKPEN